MRKFSEPWSRCRSRIKLHFFRAKSRKSCWIQATATKNQILRENMSSRYLNPHNFGTIRHFEERIQLNISRQDTLLECLPPKHFAPAPAPVTATAQTTPEADGPGAGCCTRPRFARPGVPWDPRYRLPNTNCSRSLFSI